MQKPNISSCSFLAIGALLIFAVAAIGGLIIMKDAVDNTPGKLLEGLGTQAADILKLTPTIRPNPATIIHNIQAMARLQTIQYTIEKVVVAESGQGPFGFLFGDKLLLVAHGTVTAGVDLSRLIEGDMWFVEDTLYVHLPDAEIFTATLDNEKTYVYDREQGILTGSNYTLETEARQAAEDEILAAALVDGILEQAQTNAETFLVRLLWDLGFKDVVFTSETPTP